MCREAYGSYFVCIHVCVFVPSVNAFFHGLWAKVCGSTDIIPCFLSLQFADLQNKPRFEIWHYLLTSKALVSAYDSSTVLIRLPFSLKVISV